MPDNPSTAEPEENPYRSPLAMYQRHFRDAPSRLRTPVRILSAVLFTCAGTLVLFSVTMAIAIARLGLVDQIWVAVGQASLAAIFVATGFLIRRKG